MEVTFGFMSVELTQEVSDRLVSDHYGWLTKPRAEMKRKMAKDVTEN